MKHDNLFQHIFKKKPNSKNRRFLDKFKRFLRYIYLKLFKAKHSPHQVALGFSIGAFVGIFPTFGVGIFLITFLAGFFRFSFPASIIGTLIANPWFGAFWAYMSYKIGKKLIHFKIEFVADNSFFSTIIKGFNLSINYIVGNLLISIAVGLVSYFIIKYLILFYRKEKDFIKTKLNHKKI